MTPDSVLGFFDRIVSELESGTPVSRTVRSRIQRRAMPVLLYVLLRLQVALWLFAGPHAMVAICVELAIATSKAVV